MPTLKGFTFTELVVMTVSIVTIIAPGHFPVVVSKFKAHIVAALIQIQGFMALELEKTDLDQNGNVFTVFHLVTN